MSSQTTITLAGKGRPARGCVTVPGDKSISHRALIIGCLSKEGADISNLLDSEDVRSTKNALRLLGASIETSAGKTTARAEKLSPPSGVVDCGNSGTTARLLTGILCAQPFKSALTGDRYLVKRPMERVIKPLSLMGARISADGGRLPVLIDGGEVSAIRYETPVASAQVKSAILLAGLFADEQTQVVEPVKTRDHTEIMLRRFGARVESAGKEVTLEGGSLKDLAGAEVDVPADISSAIFPVAAAAVNPGSEVVIENVGVNPERTGGIEILKQMGADIRLLNERDSGGERVADIAASGAGKLEGIEITGGVIARAIDELPAVAAVACFARGTTKISGAAELRVKESDRIEAMTQGLRNLGAKVEDFEDGMRIDGCALKAGVCSSAGDHRVAMALAVAASGAEGNSAIEGADCAAVSFRGFFEFLEKLRSGK